MLFSHSPVAASVAPPAPVVPAPITLPYMVFLL
jgi:hypothetical protein